MKTLVHFLVFLSFSAQLLAQAGKPPRSGRERQPRETKGQILTSQRITLEAEFWEAAPQKVEFLTHEGVAALKILPNAGEVILKGVRFRDGTIEFDVDPQDPSFVGIHFRRQSSAENEYVYLRVARAGKPNAIDAVQYAPYLDGVNLWDMLPHFQGPAMIQKKAWNHVKLVISGWQLRVYINDLTRPVLEIPRLEGNGKEGGISFDGIGIVANVVVKQAETEGLPASEGTDLTNHDPNYLRQWAVTQPVPLPNGRELFEGDFPTAETPWDSLPAERRGLVNLTRKFGKSTARRVVWLKTNLRSAAVQKRLLQLGFSDEVWVFVNRQIVFVDKNIYRSPGMRKTPDGRCALENASVSIPLKVGENELLIGVANDFFGWGLLARLDSLEGLD